MSPGRKAAICLISTTFPRIWSSISRRTAGALMIKVFRVTIACEQDFTAVSRAIFKCRIISDEPVCVLGTVVAIAAALKVLVSVYKKISGQAKEIATATGVTYAQGKLLAKQALAQGAYNKTIDHIQRHLTLEEELQED